MPVFEDCRNPVLPPDLHIPDPEAHVMPDGRIYVYGSWDQLDDGTFCSHQYRVVSSADMIDWTDHGVSFSAEQASWISAPDTPQYPQVDWDWSDPPPFLQGTTPVKPEKAVSPTKNLLFAPDAAYRDGKYYLYFCTSNGLEGVAVADRPEGPFRDPVQLPCGGIDPAVLVEDNGDAYFYWGQFRASGAKLTDSMIDIQQDSIVPRLVTEEEHGFHEGASVRKRNGVYYLVYSCISRGRPTSLAYATSLSPLGPFAYGGIIVDNAACDPESWNNHGSIEEVNGQWYVFYHRSSRGGRTHRRLCIEPITFAADGSIAEVPMTSQGAGRPFALGETIDAYRACELSGTVCSAPDETNREALRHIGPGDTAVYRYVQWDNPPEIVRLEGRGSGRVLVFLDDEPRPAASVPIENGVGQAPMQSGERGFLSVRLVFERPDGLELHAVCFA